MTADVDLVCKIEIWNFQVIHSAENLEFRILVNFTTNIEKTEIWLSVI